MTKCLVALSAAAVAVGLSVPGMASAANFNNAVSIRIDSSGKAFNGRVQSSRQACVGYREVSLQRRKEDQDDFTQIGTDTTRADGSWSIQTNPQVHAKYRALIRHKNLNGGSSCKAAKSIMTRVWTAAVFITRNSQGFAGTVLASSVCTPRRTVALQRRTIYQETFRTIGSDLTNRFGDWAVATNVFDGARYRATLEARQALAEISCIADTSSTLAG